MPYKILVTARTFGKVSSEPLEVLRKGNCELVENPYRASYREEDMISLLGEIDGLIVGTDPITAKMIKSSPNLKVISKHGVGVDNIDVEAATIRGIVVTNTPGTNENAVADLAFGLILSLARQIPKADRSTKEGKWERFVGRQVWGKTIGIVGLGRIGKGVARRARGFNMEILAYDVYLDESFAGEYGIRYVPLEELLEKSDFVTLHLPLTKETAKLIDERAISLMKRDSFLINTARGEIVDEEALYKALKEGGIAGAAVDTYSKEPPSSNPLLKLENVIATPHMGAHTYEAIRDMGLMAAENVVRVLRGERPLSVVNPEVYGEKIGK